VDDVESDLGQRTARGGVITIAAQTSKFFFATLITIILSRLLTPEDYGLVGMVGVVTGFLSIFRDLGLGNAIIQADSLSHRQISSLFWVNVAFSLLMTVLTASLSPLVSWFFSDHRLTLLTASYAVGFLLGGLSVQHEAILKRRMRFGLLAAIDLSSVVIGATSGVIAAWTLRTYWALVAGTLTQTACYTIGVWICCPWQPGWPQRNAGARSLLVFGRNQTGFSILNYFSRNLDNVLIGRFWGSQSLGLYSRAYQLLMLPIDQINAPIGAVAIPALSRLNTSPEKYRAAYIRMVEKLALITMPLTAYLMIVSDWVVLLLLGPNWQGVSPIFSILALAGLIQPICSTAGWLFISQGRTAEILRWGIVSSVMIVLSFTIGLKWGAVGVALAYSCTFVVLVAPLLFWFVGRSGPVKARHIYSAIAPAAFSTIVALAVGASIRLAVSQQPPIRGLAITFVLTFVTYGVCVLAIPKGRAALIDIWALLSRLMLKHNP
jgi:PST family polysaccharide transporter